MASGKIKTLVTQRGFGFIEDSAGGEVFFHRSALPESDFDSLHEGTQVEYESEADPRNAGRTRAVNVRVMV